MIIPVELAAQYILQTEAPLSDIALHCGFTDQAHRRKHFRRAPLKGAQHKWRKSN